MKKWNSKLALVVSVLFVASAAFTGCGDSATSGTKSESAGGSGAVTETTDTASADASVAGTAASTVVHPETTVAGDEAKEDVSELDLTQYVKLPDFSALSVNVDAAEEVDEEYVAYLVNYMYSSMAGEANTESMITDRAVAEGDLIVLDYCGKKDGVAFDGGTAQDATLLIGSDTFIDGFEDGLIGVMVGDTVDLDLTFPENYGSTELAGAAVVFTCTVKGIVPEEAIFAVWNATAADASEEIHSLEDMSAYFRNYLTLSAQADRETEISNQLVELLVGETEFINEFPQAMLEKYQGQASDLLDNAAASYGMERSAIAESYFGMTEEQFLSDYSYEQIQIDAIFTAIAKEQGIEFTEEELNEKISALALEYGYDDSSELFESRDECELYFTKMEVLDYLLDVVNVVEE